MRMLIRMRAGGLGGLLLASIAVFASRSFSAPQTPASSDIPVVKGGAGACTADFVVTDPSGKGIYDAKIRLQLKYGFGGFHRLDATVGTNVDGKARFEGLPEQIRKDADFTVSRGDQTKTLPYDPQADCHPKHEVTLGEK
jgi:hypothetical protein